jgi:hypothetical protein
MDVCPFRDPATLILVVDHDAAGPWQREISRQKAIRSPHIEALKCNSDVQARRMIGLAKRGFDAGLES